MRKDTSTLKEQIFQELHRQIILGDLTADQLITEKGLMEQFQASRAPVREALVELCNENILHSIPCYGYKIVPLTAEDIRQIQDYRVILECGFLSRNWNLISPEHIRSLQEIVERGNSAGRAQDAYSHWSTNMEFHTSLFSIYHNKTAQNSLQHVLNIQARAYAQITWQRFQMPRFIDGDKTHMELITAMADGHWNDAVELLEKDIRSI